MARPVSGALRAPGIIQNEKSRPGAAQACCQKSFKSLFPAFEIQIHLFRLFDPVSHKDIGVPGRSTADVAV